MYVCLYMVCVYMCVYVCVSVCIFTQMAYITECVCACVYIHTNGIYYTLNTKYRHITHIQTLIHTDFTGRAAASEL